MDRGSAQPDGTVRRGVGDNLRKCRIFLTAGHLGRIIAEEVVPQDDGDAQEHFGVDAPALEDVVHVGPFAGEASCEPRYGALLAAELRFDQFSDMYHRFGSWK